MITCHPDGIVGTGPTDAKVMLIGIAPGTNEMQSKKPFTGQSGTLMNNILKSVGWDRSLCYLTNALCYQVSEPSLEQIMGCRDRLLEEIALVKPELIVTLGAAVGNLFFSDKKFSDIRGIVDFHPHYNCYVLPTYHPAAVLHSSYGKKSDSSFGPSIGTDIFNDFKKIPTFFSDGETGRKALREVTYTLVSTPEEAQRVLDSLPCDVPVMLDVETGYEEIDAQEQSLLCLAISTGTHTWVFTQHFPTLVWPKNVRWGAHYATFDAQVMMKLGIDIEIHEDSLLAHYALDERSGRHKLKPLTREHLYAGFYEEKMAGILGKSTKHTDPKDLWEYNAKDAAYEARLLNERFVPQMKEEGVYDLYTDLLIPAVNVFKHMQYEGVYISRSRLRGLAEKWIPLYESKEQLLREKVVQWGGPENINFNSPVQMRRFLYGTLRLPGGPSTAKEVIELLKDEHPFVAQLIDIRHLEHLMGTYLFGINNEIKKDGRLHPIPLLHGTVGGRCSYNKPSVNTIPRPYDEASAYGPELRKLFIAEDDEHIIVEVDYEQAEIWMAYAYCRDEQLLLDLQTGDIHTNTAAFIHEIPIDQVRKAQRSDAKRTTFGKFYGIGVTKLGNQIKKSPEETAKFASRWDARYPDYKRWAEDVVQKCRIQGYVETITHRRRRFPIMVDTSVRNQIINFPIQATSHDCLLSSIIELYWPLRELDCHIQLDVHDAFIGSFAKKNLPKAISMIREIMTRPRFPGLPSIPVEVKVGPSWGETVKWE